MTGRHHQSGNILVYILGAVFLLGLLMIMVRGGTLPGIGIDTERVTVKVSEVQQYGAELEKAVAFIIRNGYSEVDIRFAHPTSTGFGYGTITDIPQRQVFSDEGGGATWRDPPEGSQTTADPWIFTGAVVVVGVGKTLTNAKGTELIALLPYVTKEFCVRVNDLNGIDNVSGNPPRDLSPMTMTSKFTGSYAYSNVISEYVHTATNSLFYGHLEGCFEGGGTPPTGTYHYYRVLLPR